MQKIIIIIIIMKDKHLTLLIIYWKMLDDIVLFHNI